MNQRHSLPTHNLEAPHQQDRNEAIDPVGHTGKIIYLGLGEGDYPSDVLAEARPEGAGKEEKKKSSSSGLWAVWATGGALFALPVVQAAVGNCGGGAQRSS